MIVIDNMCKKYAQEALNRELNNPMIKAEVKALGWNVIVC